MKQLLITLLFLPFLCAGQTITGKVDLSNYYTKAQVDSAIKAGSKPTVPPVVIPPIAKLDSCVKGPFITSISKITSTGASLNFDALNVRGINYQVLSDAGVPLYSDSLPNLQSSLVAFKYGALGNGSYYLRISGRTCLSKPDQRKFTVKTDEGEVIPPPVDNSPTAKFLALSRGMDEHLKLDIVNGIEPGTRFITDVSTEQRGSNYNYRYIIGGHIITQKNKLKNYPVAGNNPIRVLKFKLRDDLSTINKWGTQDSDYFPGSYYERTTGEVFSFNTSFAFNTLVAPSAQAASGFLNHISQSYDPSNQQPSWADVGDEIALPSGHIWIANWQGWTPDIVFKKGVTNLPHHNLPWNQADGNKQALALKAAGKTYNNVPRNEVIFNLSKAGADDYSNGWNRAWWPNGPFDDATAIRKAEEADISDAIWIGETSENESWMPASARMWDPFYTKLNDRYHSKWDGKAPWYIVHNYFFLWPSEISLTRNRSLDYHLSLLHAKPDSLPRTEYSPGGTLSKTTMVTEAIYLNAPDLSIATLYETIFRFDINSILGYDSGIFLFAVHEYRPNNKYKYTYPEGTFYKDDKIPLDPNLHIGAGFLAQVYGKLFIEWGASSKSKEKRFDPEWTTGWWYPNGSDSPQGGFPYYKNSSDTYYGFNGGSDLSYFSQRLYAKTFGLTDGGDRKYLKFRVDGGDWVKPSKFRSEEVVYAYFQQRGFVFSQTKNGKTAWFYFNAFADNIFHTLEVELPSGEIVSNKVAGNGIHVKIQ